MRGRELSESMERLCVEYANARGIGARRILLVGNRLMFFYSTDFPIKRSLIGNSP